MLVERFFPLKQKSPFCKVQASLIERFQGKAQYKIGNRCYLPYQKLSISMYVLPMVFLESGACIISLCTEKEHHCGWIIDPDTMIVGYLVKYHFESSQRVQDLMNSVL